MRVAAYAAVSVFTLATAKNARIQRLKRKSKQPIAHFWARRRFEEKKTTPQSDVYIRIIARQAGLKPVGQASTGPRTPTQCGVCGFSVSDRYLKCPGCMVPVATRVSPVIYDAGLPCKRCSGINAPLFLRVAQSCRRYVKSRVKDPCSATMSAMRKIRRADDFCLICIIIDSGSKLKSATSNFGCLRKACA